MYFKVAALSAYCSRRGADDFQSIASPEVEMGFTCDELSFGRAGKILLKVTYLALDPSGPFYHPF